MKTKLTLSVDKDLVKYARTQAQKNGRSVSGMFSEFLKSQQSQDVKKTMPNVNAMVGSLKRYDIDDSKAAIRSTYAKEYIN